MFKTPHDFRLICEVGRENLFLKSQRKVLHDFGNKIFTNYRFIPRKYELNISLSYLAGNSFSNRSGSLTFKKSTRIQNKTLPLTSLIKVSNSRWINAQLSLTGKKIFQADHLSKKIPRWSALRLNMNISPFKECLPRRDAFPYFTDDWRWLTHSSHPDTPLTNQRAHFSMKSLCSIAPMTKFNKVYFESTRVTKNKNQPFHITFRYVDLRTKIAKTTPSVFTLQKIVDVH